MLHLTAASVKDSKSILVCYNKLVKSEINDKCVNKVIEEKSISHARKVISSLNYCDDKDKELYLNGEITSTELYHRKDNADASLGTDSLEERAKRLKDDSEVPLTYAMITDMLKSETANYMEALYNYTDMVDDVYDKCYTSEEALMSIDLAYAFVTKAITSLKETIINKSNTVMEE